MTRDEFLAGCPFKMPGEGMARPVYSYVDVGGMKCIQIYMVINPNPMYHCKVVEADKVGVKVRAEILGQEFHTMIPYSRMELVGDGLGDGLPIRTFTRDLVQANIYDDRGNFKVVIHDLYAGSKLGHLTKTWPTLDGAAQYARKTINYKD